MKPVTKCGPCLPRRVPAGDGNQCQVRIGENVERVRQGCWSGAAGSARLIDLLLQKLIDVGERGVNCGGISGVDCDHKIVWPGHRQFWGGEPDLLEVVHVCRGSESDNRVVDPGKPR